MKGPQQAERLWFLVPGDLDTPTGGYRYDRRMIDGLRSLGWHVEHPPLDASFPHPTRAALQQTRELLAAIPDGALVVVDGLAYGALPEVVEDQGQRLGLIALVHHPLWLETGLAAARSRTLRRSESRALAMARRVIVTSPATARLLEGQGVPAERLRVVTPGLDPSPAATGSAGPGPCLLCVATVTPRKGHDLLLRALSPPTPEPWRLDCVGSLERDPRWAAEILRLRADLGLEERVTFLGALDEAALAQRYQRSDLFVLPTRFEGYGMVIAEALARGLPIVATRTGAAPELVPPQAGLLVRPEDPFALRGALDRLIGDPAFRRRLAAGARTAGLRLPAWSEAALAFSDVCQGIRPGGPHG